MRVNRPATAAAIGLAVVLSGSEAAAHAKLVGASPALNAAGPAPARIVLRFNEKLAAKFSGFDVTSGGRAVPVKVVAARDSRTLVGAPLKPLAPGAYRVAWRVVAADAHQMRGTYVFTVR